MQTHHNYTESQIVNIKLQFTAMDKDGDGAISEQEFLEALTNSNRNPEEYDLQTFFTKADKNKDGKISFNEFLDACHDLGLGREKCATGTPTKKSAKEIDAIFRNFDLDGNGYISAQELSQVLAKQGEHLSKEEIKDMIKTADLNGDNQIDREEFARMI
ncbi:calmodulin-like protein 5 [Gamsiella multidivaricata]|uniref:calmodulin-like protein 5 n=1 Tax=Gamsiella multidivaricata TaxID=101098 RepID=UPI00221EAE09|nr:calmodulin-like protein 5 [Gamsiella multidivaricata]KAG0358791.1 calmodulin-like 3 [Gamsiella multidivaricata]KAI7825724.1 calmodulin-like protein 5 [Gamsiella multidivaricata]